MAEILKSALFVDYDSIHRSLAAAGRDGDALAQRTSAWVVAIESGRLVAAKGGATSRRRFALRRCYADPARLGKNRIAFVAAGFELIDCPAPADGQKNAAGMNIALDVLEALAHPTAYEEFVLLSADSDLTPIIQRLHSLERAAVIYANAATPPSVAQLADGVVEEAKLTSLLFAEDAPRAPAAAAASAPKAAAPPARPAPPAPAPAKPAAAPPPQAAGGDRADIEALARRIHAATNIPLLSPRTFAELFKALAEEITERGYHFQETAERVSSKLTSAGRNVTRRQVVFVVKGLALKGHVFSTTDNAERLADVFREQVLYLAGNAALELTEREQALLPAWITGRVGTVSPPAAAQPPAPIQPQPAPQPDERTAKRKPVRPLETRPEPPAPPPMKADPKPVEPARPAAAAPAPRPAPAAPARPAPPPKSQPRPAAVPKPAPAQKAAPKSPPAPRPQAKEAASSDALESSILAAIAQAVDVLIEDGHEGAKPPQASPPAGQQESPSASPADQPKPDPTPSQGGDGDDIGDEIQRIIASYSKARQQGDG